MAYPGIRGMESLGFWTNSGQRNYGPEAQRCSSGVRKEGAANFAGTKPQSQRKTTCRLGQSSGWTA
jgi:hypothetical protein